LQYLGFVAELAQEYEILAQPAKKIQIIHVRTVCRQLKNILLSGCVFKVTIQSETNPKEKFTPCRNSYFQ
jgi:hypothetical protein